MMAVICVPFLPFAFFARAVEQRVDQVFPRSVEGVL
jgi:hypothetical protein